MGFLSRSLIAALAAAGLALAAPAGAQCLLANPSFELSGSGTTFGGWYQFGPTTSSTEASHGHRSARVSGPNTGSLSVAGYWQPFDTAPGERWQASVRVWNTSSQPLTGGSRAILNIEWRDGGGGLISYESYDVATAASPTDQWIDYAVESGPAPTGTAQTRLLLAVVQEAGDPQPTVLFDEATFENAGPPTLDDIQWNDFPGGRTVTFSGRSWRVKGPGYYGPGPSLFRDTADAVWVDANGALHLTVKKFSNTWYSTEVTAEQALGYGDYVFTTVGRLDQLDQKIVFGLFLWQYGRCYDPGWLWWNPYNEIDVEFSRWDNPAREIAQFVAQPYDYPGNLRRFDPTFADGELTSHAFRWLPDRVEFRSWRGGPADESPGNMIYSWNYTGPHIPRPEQPRVHLNLWQYAGPPATNQEVVLDAFTFVPEGGNVAVPEPAGAGGAALRAAAAPNPTTGATRIHYTLPRGGPVELAIYDVSGRRVRTLVDGVHPAGSYEAAWDGRDDAGLRPAPGVYLYRLTSGRNGTAGRLVLLQ